MPGLGGQAAFHSETGAALIRFSRAGYQALEPYGDLSSVKVRAQHPSLAPHHLLAALPTDL